MTAAAPGYRQAASRIALVGCLRPGTCAVAIAARCPSVMTGPGAGQGSEGPWPGPRWLARARTSNPPARRGRVCGGRFGRERCRCCGSPRRIPAVRGRGGRGEHGCPPARRDHPPARAALRTDWRWWSPQQCVPWPSPQRRQPIATWCTFHRPVLPAIRAAAQVSRPASAARGRPTISDARGGLPSLWLRSTLGSP